MLKIRVLSGIVFEQVDLSIPETIPSTLVGIHTVIDCGTGRPEEPIKTISTIAAGMNE
ncbi:Hypothetical predicted protein [Olea europaea subsp. europaea]|uniref:Uncharacterized protein n=1 Tax=Olea europaea subsp. europaea TaxID=158383 RepID=A0A8S0QY52_OLEEU|nr:Hypothetical predicted protein [Olea europaea subsp. europaea]